MNHSPKRQIFSCLVLFFYANLSCSSSNNMQPGQGWHYEVAPYGWMSSINGNLMVKGFAANIHIPFGEILKHLQFAAQGHFEAGYGPWSLMLDPTYLKVSDTHQQRALGLKIISKSLLADAGIFYRVYYNKFISLEVLGGERHFGIRNTLNIDQFFSTSETVMMNAPIVGARFKTSISPKSYFWLRGDIGGFHVDHVSQTWSVTAGLTYALKSYIDLGLAYRAIEIDYAKNTSLVNVLLHGPALGISFHG